MRVFVPFVLALLAALSAVVPEAYAQGEEQPDEPRLVLTAVDDSTGGRIVGATVSVVSADVRVETNRFGIARVSVPSGLHFVRVEKEGYGPVAFTVDVMEGEIAGEVGMAPVIDLPAVTTTAERVRRDLERSGFAERREAGRGEFFDYDDIVRKGQGELSTILRGVAGLRLQRLDGVLVAVTNRTSVSLGGYQAASPCPYTIYKDRMIIGDDETFDVSRIGTRDLAGIEVYPGPASTPPEYRQFNACGVILLWSRLE